AAMKDLIAQADSRVRFKKALQQVEDGIHARDLEAAGKAMTNAQLLAGTDRKLQTLALEKQKLFDLVQALDAKRKEFVGTLKESDGLKDEQIDDNTYQKLVDAQNNLPSDADREKIVQE